jgi:DNA replication protein DnaC
MDSIQEKALKMALNGHNLLIIGYPETGKSFTVVHIAEQLQKQARYFVLTATTGKAAQAFQEKLPKCLNKVVTTIHKCLGLKDDRCTNDELVELLSSEESHEKLKRNISAMDCLIIDEIFMFSLKMIEQVQHVLCKFRQSDYPFGGVQMI